ncbi:MAG: hypothetical protein ACRDNS_13005, partial [Trebonia sp.]
ARRLLTGSTAGVHRRRTAMFRIKCLTAATGRGLRRGMSTTQTREASMSPKQPSQRQLSYLKALANVTGETFTYPETSAQASREIQRLKRARPSTAAERAIERFGDTQAIEAAQGAVEVHGFEIVGYGPNCTWSQRS